MKNVNCDVNVAAKVKIPNSLHFGLPDVDLIMCNNDLHRCILRCHPMLRLNCLTVMLKFIII